MDPDHSVDTSRMSSVGHATKCRRPGHLIRDILLEGLLRPVIVAVVFHFVCGTNSSDIHVYQQHMNAMSQLLTKLESDINSLKNSAPDVVELRQKLQKIEDDRRTLRSGFNLTDMKLSLRKLEDENKLLNQKLELGASKTNADSEESYHQDIMQIQQALQTSADECKAVERILATFANKYERDKEAFNIRLRQHGARLQQLNDAGLCLGWFCRTTFEFNRVY